MIRKQRFYLWIWREYDISTIKLFRESRRKWSFDTDSKRIVDCTAESDTGNSKIRRRTRFFII